jgi:hypothetical protein
MQTFFVPSRKNCRGALLCCDLAMIALEFFCFSCARQIDSKERVLLTGTPAVEALLL